MELEDGGRTLSKMVQEPLETMHLALREACSSSHMLLLEHQVCPERERKRERERERKREKCTPSNFHIVWVVGPASGFGSDGARSPRGLRDDCDGGAPTIVVVARMAESSGWFVVQQQQQQLQQPTTITTITTTNNNNNDNINNNHWWGCC